MLLELVLFGTFLLFLYKWLASSFTPWESRGIAFLRKPYPLIGGLRWSDLKELKHAIVSIPEAYELCGSNKYCISFVFHKPCLMIKDPEMIREVGIKAADHFIDRTMDKNWVDIHPEMNRMLTVLTGDTWKKVRAGLSPAFTTGKLKIVAQTMIKSGKRFQDYIVRERSKAADGLLEGKALVGQFALSIVGESVYGVSNIDAFAEEESEFIKNCKKTSFKTDGKSILISIGYFAMPKVMKFFNLKMIDTASYHYLANVTKGILKQRRDTNYKGKDMVQVMLDVQAKQKQSLTPAEGEEEDSTQFEKDAQLKGVSASDVTMDEETIVQSTTLFLIAGFDTVGSTVSIILYYLATHPEIQERLRQEVDDIAEGLEEKDVLTYDDFSSMEFMERVIHESMRIAPAAPAADRLCVKDYRMPDGGFIPKGTLAILLNYGVHMDPKYFEEPEKFDPDRWTPENKAKMTPYTQLGFGIGPRNCIGMRFAMLEMKTCLFYIFRKFVVKPSEKTPSKPVWDAYTVLTAIKGGNWLKFEDRV